MSTLSVEDFKQLVKNAPLVSIDLIIEDTQGNILLGLRNNLPAKGYWFVPGGRINKDEHFTDAFKRIVKNETGLSLEFKMASFLGAYEHIYPQENFLGDPSFGTHYIVFAYRIKLMEPVLNLPKKQHTAYWWAAVDEIIENTKVHVNTRNYFNEYPSFTHYISDSY